MESKKTKHIRQLTPWKRDNAHVGEKVALAALLAASAISAPGARAYYPYPTAFSTTSPTVQMLHIRPIPMTQMIIAPLQTPSGLKLVAPIGGPAAGPLGVPFGTGSSAPAGGATGPSLNNPLGSAPFGFSGTFMLGAHPIDGAGITGVQGFQVFGNPNFSTQLGARPIGSPQVYGYNGLTGQSMATGSFGANGFIGANSGANGFGTGSGTDATGQPTTNFVTPSMLGTSAIPQFVPPAAIGSSTNTFGTGFNNGLGTGLTGFGTGFSNGFGAGFGAGSGTSFGTGLGTSFGTGAGAGAAGVSPGAATAMGFGR